MKVVFRQSERIGAFGLKIEVACKAARVFHRIADVPEQPPVERLVLELDAQQCGEAKMLGFDINNLGMIVLDREISPGATFVIGKPIPGFHKDLCRFDIVDFS